MDRTQATRSARRLLLREYHGVLSTLSVEAPGYPFGSVVPYCLDRDGHPVILISRIAQHTKNIEADPRASLIAVEKGIDDIQSAARLTLLANAVRVPDDDSDTALRYYAYFANATEYHRVHGFDFYRLALVRVRYIGGFGEIHWIAPNDLPCPNPFTRAQEQAMVHHMNADHGEALAGYCRAAGIPIAPGSEPSLVGIDAEGFHLRVGTRLVRFEFATAVGSPLEVRAALMAMARA